MSAVRLLQRGGSYSGRAQAKPVLGKIRYEWQEYWNDWNDEFRVAVMEGGEPTVAPIGRGRTTPSVSLSPGW